MRLKSSHCIKLQTKHFYHWLNLKRKQIKTMCQYRLHDDPLVHCTLIAWNEQLAVKQIHRTTWLYIEFIKQNFLCVQYTVKSNSTLCENWELLWTDIENLPVPLCAYEFFFKMLTTLLLWHIRNIAQLDLKFEHRGYDFKATFYRWNFLSQWKMTALCRAHAIHATEKKNCILEMVFC